MKRLKNVIRKILRENEYRLIKLIYEKRNKREISTLVRGYRKKILINYE